MPGSGGLSSDSWEIPTASSDPGIGPVYGSWGRFRPSFQPAATSGRFDGIVYALVPLAWRPHVPTSSRPNDDHAAIPPVKPVRIPGGERWNPAMGLLLDHGWALLLCLGLILIGVW